MTHISQTNLLRAWREGDLEEFEYALKDSGVDVNYVYPEEGYSTILESIARNHSTYSKSFAEAALKHGALNIPNVLTGNTMLHEASKIFNNHVMEAIIDKYKDVNTKNTAGDTALHILAGQPVRNEEEAERQLKCLELILNVPNVDINVRNSKGFTPAHIACQKGAWKVMDKLVEQGSKLDLDAKPLSGHGTESISVREYIQQKFPKLIGGLTIFNTEPNQIKMDGQKLFTLLRAGNEDRFSIAITKEMDYEDGHALLTYHDSNQTFLQYCTSNGLLKATKTLLQLGADVNLCHLGRRPVFLAAQAGDKEILKLLLSYNPDLSPNLKGETVLHVLLKADECSEKHKECINLLLQSNIDVNARDKSGSTALHYAVKFPYNEIAKQLLKAGADIFLEDIHKEPAYQRLPQTCLQSFLDSKIVWNGRRCEKCVLQVDCDFLRPKSDNKPKESDLEALQSFHKCSEMNRLLKFSQCKNFSSTLDHPVFKTFITHKWSLMRHFYYANLIFYLLFSIILYSYFISSNSCHYESGCLGFFVFLRIVLILFLVLRYIQGLMTLATGPLVFYGPKCIIDLFINILTAILIARGCDQSVFESAVPTYCPTISSTVAISSGIQLVLMVGQHPKFSISYVIFKTTLWNIVKIVAIYSFILISFAVSFLVLVRGCGNCSSFFVEGMIFEIPLAFNGRGHYVSSAAVVQYLLFLVILLSFSVHVITVNVEEVKHILRNKEFHILSEQIKLIAAFEEALVSSPELRIQQLKRHTNLKNISLTWLDKIALRILFFREGNRYLSIQPDNTLRTKVTKPKKLPFWKSRCQLPKKTVNNIERKVKIKTPKVVKESTDATFFRKLDHLLESSKQLSARVENLELTSRQVEELLIRLMAISSMNKEE